MSETEKKDNFLDLIPVRNCKWETTGEGKTFLVVPRFKNRWMKKIALRLGKSEVVRVYFDDNGAKVWNLVDGSKSVEEIGKLMEKEKRKDETQQQVYDRLTEFLSILARNKFISLKEQ
jgi:hypothetical protein